MLRVFADREHYSEEHRSALNDILKALWNTSTREERRATYGNRSELFEVVSSPDQADLHLLTMKWQHYVETDRVDQAVRAVEVARRAGRPIAIFSTGDSVVTLPVVGDDIHLFQMSGYRSRRGIRNHGMPAFIEDPLPTACNGELRLRDKGPRPVIGFCGQAGASLARHAVRLLRNEIKKTRWRLGRERWEPAPLEHTWFRQRVLDSFVRNPSVETRFLLRTRYRAGVQSQDRNSLAERSRREFVDNVLDTDYTICVRGGGNYSVRFYEALALGRIPIFVDTDCILPFRDQLDWGQFTAWVDAREVRDAPNIVAAQHQRLSPQEFHDRQRACRRLWKERLSPDGFYAHFHEHFPEFEK